MTGGWVFGTGIMGKNRVWTWAEWLESFPSILSRPVKLQSRPTACVDRLRRLSARAVVSSELVLFIHCIESTTKILK